MYPHIRPFSVSGMSATMMSATMMNTARMCTSVTGAMWSS